MASVLARTARPACVHGGASCHRLLVSVMGNSSMARVAVVGVNNPLHFNRVARIPDRTTRPFSAMKRVDRTNKKPVNGKQVRLTNHFPHLTS
eukprot:scaffold5839_cov49-Attheya_sp.AAC.4